MTEDAQDLDHKDRELIRQIAQDQDRRSMEALYVRYRPRLTAFLRRMTRDEGIVEEAYNDVMLNVWRKAGQFQSQSKVSTWVYSIAYRTCLRMVRKQKLRDGALELFGREPENAERSESEDRVQADLISAALERLSAPHRLVIELSYFCGYSTAEIGQIANCPANTVKTRLFHARMRIREFVEQQSG